jgi:signal transduction histidine kinase
LLHSHVEGDEGREFLGIAESQLERVSQITRQTLAFYTGKTSPQVVDLRATLDAVVSTLTSKIANKRIRLVRHEQSCEVLGLKTELHQLFLNLLDNAIDATPSNGRIEIAAVPQGSKAVITITDTGEGIRADHLPKLFEPFFTTKEHLGPGLGLWAAREIAQRHDGSITVDSRTEGAEHGTTFKVVLGSMRRRDENASTAA